MQKVVNSLKKANLVFQRLEDRSAVNMKYLTETVHIRSRFWLTKNLRSSLYTLALFRTREYLTANEKP